MTNKNTLTPAHAHPPNAHKLRKLDGQFSAAAQPLLRAPVPTQAEAAFFAGEDSAGATTATCGPRTHGRRVLTQAGKGADAGLLALNLEEAAQLCPCPLPQEPAATVRSPQAPVGPGEPPALPGERQRGPERRGAACCPGFQEGPGQSAPSASAP